MLWLASPEFVPTPVTEEAWLAVPLSAGWAVLGRKRCWEEKEIRFTIYPITIFYFSLHGFGVPRLKKLCKTIYSPRSLWVMPFYRQTWLSPRRKRRVKVRGKWMKHKIEHSVYFQLIWPGLSGIFKLEQKRQRWLLALQVLSEKSAYCHLKKQNGPREFSLWSNKSRRQKKHFNPRGVCHFLLSQKHIWKQRLQRLKHEGWRRLQSRTRKWWRRGRDNIRSNWDKWR